MREIWRDIPDYEGKYQVSNMGNVRNIIRGKNLKGRLDMYGYYRVILYKKGIRYKRRKMSEANKRREHKPHTQETKHRQSIARKKWWSEHKARKEEC